MSENIHEHLLYMKVKCLTFFTDVNASGDGPLRIPLEDLLAAEEKGKPVDTRGSIDFSGESGLDGKVADVRQMMEKLGRSERVLQSFLRHVFRFWMGRNEELRDSKTLLAMQEAYRESEGSFREVLVALLTSDSFLYRKRSR